MASARRLVVLSAVLAALAAAAPAGAQPYANVDFTVTSSDGARIRAYFTPASGLEQGERAPTVLLGSGWSAPAYPRTLGEVGQTSLGPLGSFGGELPGPAALTADGYNVITWDNRGWYGSGGQVMLDRPEVEGRDVSALIDWLAEHPAAELDGPGDPGVGMAGASYGGGVQLAAAIVDDRIDAIIPNMSWYSLIDSLYPNETIKSGWGNYLCFAALITGANLHRMVDQMCESARAGWASRAEIEFGEASSPGPRIGEIKAPALILGGTVDTLFPLQGNVDTYNALRRAGTPARMIWYCGGHGLCNQHPGPAGHVADAQRAFLARYLKGLDVDLGPGFQYVDQHGAWRSADSYPIPTTGSVSGRGEGWLPLSFFSSSGLLGIVATPAFNAINIPIDPPRTSVDVTEPPRLRLSYQGWATMGSAPVFAQLVDTTTGKVLGNISTPVQLKLDGEQHSVEADLAIVPWNLTPSSRITLQITDGSNLFFGQMALGLVWLQAEVTLPTHRPGEPVHSAAAAAAARR